MMGDARTSNNGDRLHATHPQPWHKQLLMGWNNNNNNSDKHDN
jgi:hypothetical protein